MGTPEKGFDLLHEALKAKRHSVVRIQRGLKTQLPEEKKVDSNKQEWPVREPHIIYNYLDLNLNSEVGVSLKTIGDPRFRQQTDF